MLRRLLFRPRNATTERAVANAQQGLAFFDQRYPGWQNTVPADVDISSPIKCIYVCGDQMSQVVRDEYLVLTMTFRAGREDRLREEERRLRVARVPQATEEVRELAAV